MNLTKYIAPLIFNEELDQYAKGFDNFCYGIMELQLSEQPIDLYRSKIKAVVEANSARPVPQWIDVNRSDLSAKVIALPNRDQIDAPVEEQLIVEFYSK